MISVTKTYGQRELKGNILTEGEITIGVSVYTTDLLMSTLTDINGDFKLVDLPNRDFVLIINPCCTCLTRTEILIEKDVFEVEIDCNCKKSKAIIVKSSLINGEVKEKRTKIRI
jgi:hypothetical protein